MRYDTARTFSQNQNNLEHLGDYFQSELTRFETMPLLISQTAQISDFLFKPAYRQSANYYLADIQQASGASDVYLMDKLGNVIASSNFQESYSYVGSNFAFRRYFTQAVEAGKAIDFAVGLRSKARGIYFSHAIVIDGSLQGVAVVKVNASLFEQARDKLDTGEQNDFFLLDEHGIVLMSSQAQWRILASRAIAKDIYQDLQHTQQFSDYSLTPQNWRFDSQSHLFQPSNSTHKGKQYIYASKPFVGPFHRLFLVSPIDHFTQAQWLRLGIASVCLFLLFIVIELMLARRAGYLQLVFSQKTLEQEVQARTTELAQTQQALIRAAKLATIGQLSASINHEINQPLMAMSAYIASIKRLIAKGEHDKAQQTILLVDELIQRVHKIVAQLKHFSKSQSNPAGLHSLQKMINNALIIVGPELKKNSVSLSKSEIEAQVWVEPLKCEQVLINLLSNACYAMQQSAEKQLNIDITDSENDVRIIISDTGEGIAPHAIENIFEPFFTTKAGTGLGLGLSISKEIITSFNGQLSAKNNDTLGASFTILLSKQQDKVND